MGRLWPFTCKEIQAAWGFRHASQATQAADPFFRKFDALSRMYGRKVLLRWLLATNECDAPPARVDDLLERACDEPRR